MQVEVYETETEVYEAVAAHAVGLLAAVTTGRRAVVAVPGGRQGRALMLALASHDDLPWLETDWCVTHDGLTVAAGEVRAVDLLREEFGRGRGVPDDRIHAPDAAPSLQESATGYDRALRRLTADNGEVDLVCLLLSADGDVAAWRVAGGDMPSDRLAVAAGQDLVTVTPALVAAARAVVVVAIGAEVCDVVTRVLRGGDHDETAPVRHVVPSERVTWFSERAAVTELLRGAEPVEA